MAFSNELIPNNVNLSGDRKLQRALEEWHPKFLKWWREMGPDSHQEKDIYLRTAISVEDNGWAHYDYVKLPDYRWGIFLTPPRGDSRIHFGDRIGEPTWNEVPGEHRKELRRLIVTQADTEPASVEQQRMLAHSAPSLYDMRNLFQVNVEEGRHLWAMVYLLIRFFGKDGREEAEDLLIRRSGHPDTPRILTTFNEPITDWLDFFCFTMFTDRDGKFQLGALAESAFEPLGRSTRFMLTEEAHHLYVGESGIGRAIRRSAQLSRAGDPLKLGAIPLPIIQKYINHWYSRSLDLFGAEDSANAAAYFAAGLKGRFNESNRAEYPDPRALDGDYSGWRPDSHGGLVEEKIPMRRALNAVLQDSYRQDCAKAVKRWNLVLEEEGCDLRITLPSPRFDRKVGLYAGSHYTPAGEPLAPQDWDNQRDTFLPTVTDRSLVKGLMARVVEPGQFANWIAPPSRGINKQPVEFVYVRL